MSDYIACLGPTVGPGRGKHVHAALREQPGNVTLCGVPVTGYAVNTMRRIIDWTDFDGDVQYETCPACVLLGADAFSPLAGPCG